MKRSLFYIVILTIGLSCSEEDPNPVEDFVVDFYSGTTDLEIVVGYEEDAEPYINFNGNNAWDITQDNTAELLSGKNITLSIPKTLVNMKYLGNFQQESFTNEEISAIASELVSVDNKGSKKQLVALFFDGYFNKDGDKLEQVIGLNIDNTPILVIFKPVVKSASPSSPIRTLVEQTTLCHEIGHALGLVDNGVELTSEHLDSEHGAHCSNENCVMYWQNGGGNVVDFIQPFLSGNNIDLFGQECLNDVLAK